MLGKETKECDIFIKSWKLLVTRGHGQAAPYSLQRKYNKSQV